MQQDYLMTTQGAVLADSRHKVLRNTYLLLGATLAFSAAMAGVSMTLHLPYFGLLTLLVYFGLLFAVHKTRDSGWGIVWTFALTGFLGLTLGPILEAYIRVLPNGSQIVMTSLGVTAAAFLGLSAYAVKSEKDFSFLGGFLWVGAIGAFVSVLQRITSDKSKFTVHYDLGKRTLYMLGSYRPVLGAVFGVFTYFVLASGILQTTKPDDSKALYYYGSLAFVAGFSERFTQVLAKSVEGLVPAQGTTDESDTGARAEVEDEGNAGRGPEGGDVRPP